MFKVILDYKHICANSRLVQYKTNVDAISLLGRHRSKVQSSPVLHLIQMLPWLNVISPTPHHVIHTSNDQHSAKHNRRPVHVLSIRRDSDGEERSHSRGDHVESRERIDRGSVSAKRKASRRQRLPSQTLGQNARRTKCVAEACGACEECDDGI